MVLSLAAFASDEVVPQPEEPSQPEPKVLTTKKIAQRLEVHERTALNIIRTIPGAFQINGMWRVYEEDYNRFIEGLQKEAEEERKRQFGG